MAAVTVDSRVDSVFGNYRAIMAQVDIANTGDTYTTGLSTVLFAASNVPASVTAITASGGVLTFTTGGAVNNAQIFVVGN